MKVSTTVTLDCVYESDEVGCVLMRERDNSVCTMYYVCDSETERDGEREGEMRVIARLDVVVVRALSVFEVGCVFMRERHTCTQ